uniref:Uncharacterized protein n=1 Tax=Anopheles farauti TaxID=69004 RepID=A0A182QW76_9DIPT
MQVRRGLMMALGGLNHLDLGLSARSDCIGRQADDGCTLAAAAAARTIAAEDDDGGGGVGTPDEWVGLPVAVTDIAAAEVGGAAAAIDIGIGIRIDVSEDALLLLVMVLVSSVPYSPIGPGPAPGGGEEGR